MDRYGAQPVGQVVDLDVRRQQRDAAAVAVTRWAAAPVRYLPEAFLRATEGLFPGFTTSDLRLLRALP